MSKISKSFFAIVMTSATFIGTSYAMDVLTGGAQVAAKDVAVNAVQDAIGAALTPKVRPPSKSSVSAADVEAEKIKAASTANAYESKNKQDAAKLEGKKAEAQAAAKKLAIEKEERARHRAEEAAERKRLEDERLAKEAAEEERIAAEEAAEQEKVKLEIERAAQEASAKAAKRAEKAKMATDIVALKKEAADLGVQLSKAESDLGKRNSEIMELRAEIARMKEQDEKIAKTILKSNTEENQLLLDQIKANAGNPGDSEVPSIHQKAIIQH